MRGSKISWYNTQFYCGWGDLSNTAGYDNIMMRGFPASKVVVGTVTNPGNGSGFVQFDVLRNTLINLRERYPGFGGVMGWEYFNSLPGDTQRPWEWAGVMTKNVRSHFLLPPPSRPPTQPPIRNPFDMSAAQIPISVSEKPSTTKSKPESVDADLPDLKDPPKEFEYFTDGNDD